YMRISMLSELLNVRPSSVTKMVQKLTEYGYLDYKKYGIIFLTGKGKKMGQFLLSRHYIIEKFLAIIGVKEKLLEETELIEHHVSTNTLKSMEQLCKFFERYPGIFRQFEQFKAEECLNDSASKPE
ncbi:MAG: DtxR family transcriptional regulator, partial [Clostridiaceae bacterium]|nr:DtxR family transcriptional regulator [Clostridiaceae bacterium]